MNRIVLLLVASLLLSCSEKGYDFEFIDINSPGSSSLRAICAVDEDIVWTSGSQGKVYLSLDGGLSWHASTVPDCEETEFRSLHAWDAKQALVFEVSPLGRAFMTKDGGNSWKELYRSSTEGVFFNSLTFANETQGIAISDPIDEMVFVLKTEDGGLTWKRLLSLPPATEGEINFAASNTCIEYLPTGEIYIVTGGTKARILTSPDHGESWSFVGTPVITGESAGLFSVNFSGPGMGVAVGGDFNHPEREGTRAIYTEDGGRHWHKAESMPAEYRSCVVSLGDDFHFAIGKTGCDYSMDGGRNWSFIDSTGYYSASAVSGRDLLFLAGAQGRVAKVIVRKN